MLRWVRQRRQSGDTLIEVLFAVTVLSLVIVTSLSIMNQGTAAAQRSLEITLVRQEIDSQAEALRFFNTAYTAAYTPGSAIAPASAAGQYARIIKDVKDSGVTAVTQFGANGGACSAEFPDHAFVINTRLAQYQNRENARFAAPESFSQVVYRSTDNTIENSRGIWIEALRSSPADGSAYTDFHIRACWDGPGVAAPMNLGTIVRLYDPAN